MSALSLPTGPVSSARTAARVSSLLFLFQVTRCTVLTAWTVGHTVRRCKKPVEEQDSGFGDSGGGYGGEATGAGAAGDSGWGNNDQATNPVVDMPPAPAVEGW